MVDVEAEARTGTCGSPLQHFQVAIGIAKRRDGPAADEAGDANRLARLVVDEIDLGQADEHRLVVADLESRLDRAAHDLLGGDPVDLLGHGTHEFDAAARDNVGLKAVGPQIR